MHFVFLAVIREPFLAMKQLFIGNPASCQIKIDLVRILPIIMALPASAFSTPTNRSGNQALSLRIVASITEAD
ncbi:MAG TPA: hypothetical protein VKX41_07660 [Alloacidobacterium sp.]|jgi:hypothetical protein|nr:hypothetical protein [Alloacidobacterium sp.]